MRYVCLPALAVVLIPLSIALAEPGVFRGEVTCSACTSYNGLVVDVRNSRHQNIGFSDVGPSGEFEFRGVGRGVYFVTVRTGQGHILHSQMVSIDGPSDHAQIVIPEKKLERPGSATVSVRQLQHEVPKQARKHYKIASKLNGKADYAGAIEHLKKAIEIDPEFVQAQNDLGSLYMIVDDPQSALAHFLKAAELEPHQALIQVNLAAAYMTMKEVASAERAARRAVDLDAANLKARYILGLALYWQNEYTDEAVDQLRRVQDVFPNAKMVLAVTLANRGEKARAISQLNAYLENDKAPNRAEAQRLLAVLNQAR